MLFGLQFSALATPDLANGKKIDQQKCYACHAKKSGFGNGDMIYTRSDSRIKSLQNLQSMVARCNSEMRLDLFPEDEADVVAYLNKQFYKFK
jgi:cytochrome c2